MKKILLLCACLAIFCACSPDNNDEDLTSENYININGDLRNLDNPGFADLEISSYWFSGNYEEPNGVQLILDAYDPEKKVIGDIGGYVNNEIELFIDLYPSETPAFLNKTSFTTYKYNDITRDMSPEEMINYKLDKGNVNLQIITGNDDEIFNQSADSGQSFTVKSEGNYYYLIIENMKFGNVTVSAKLKIPE